MNFKTKKTWKIKVINYNFNKPFLSLEKEFLSEPTEIEIHNLFIEFSEKFPTEVNYKTTLHVEEFYNVIKK